jgi:NAD-dependent SIR2 family protein deacetylase
MPGHVFLVHGHLDKLACDAWLVPSGNTPFPGVTWRNAVSSEPPANSPAQWSQVRGRVIPWEPLRPEFPRPWVVLTVNHPDGGANQFVEPAGQFLTVAAKALDRERPRNGRHKPLLALPVIGAGQAGGAHLAGEIVQHLLPVLYDFTRTNDIDIALVMKEDAQYAAAQAVRNSLMGENAWVELDDRLRHQVDHLTYRAYRKELVLFLGAGVSRAAGLPTWNVLLEELAGNSMADDREFKKLGPLDQARIIKKRVPSLGQAVAEKLLGEHYSLVHGLLASLPLQEVITTNYDNLFEKASQAAGQAVDVLPDKPSGGGRRWLLKLHGCVTKPEKIVLTREDYLRYDADRAALAGLVQGILMTRHVLFVGFSLSDDNFHRIADAVRRVSQERYGTSLAVESNRLLREIWEPDLNWVEFGKLPDSARLLEIFLDRLAAKTVTSADHLFDEKYDSTLTVSEQRLRGHLAELGELLERVPRSDRRSAAWVEVERLLERVGWRT